MKVYLDESGDLGFNFNKPYREGGSSHYLTIAFLLIPRNLSNLPKRIAKELYRKRKKSLKKELKGFQLTSDEKVFITNRVIKLLIKNPSIEIFTITVDKTRVKSHIRQDPNKLYNYMIGLVLPSRINKHSRVTFIPDKRSIKVESGNSLADYLQIKLWFELDTKTTIDNKPLESHMSLNLLFIDWISHIIWSRYEDHETKAYNILKKKVATNHLFFR